MLKWVVVNGTDRNVKFRASVVTALAIEINSWVVVPSRLISRAGTAGIIIVENNVIVRQGIVVLGMAHALGGAGLGTCIIIRDVNRAATICRKGDLFDRWCRARGSFPLSGYVCSATAGVIVHVVRESSFG